MDADFTDQPRPKPGVRFTFLDILTGSDLSRRRLPFMIATGSEPGATVWLTACGHGDEVGGIVIIQEIFKRLRRRRLLRGALYAFPLMNPIGFETASRNITLTEEDLNRCFPGNPKGSLGQRIAHRIFSCIMETSPSLVLDLHNDWIRSIPYTLLDPSPGLHRREAHEKARHFSRLTGFPVISDVEEVHSSLSCSLIRNNVPALTLELGESYVVNEFQTERGVRSVWNIMAQLDMVPADAPPTAYPLPPAFKGRVLRYSDKPYSATSGLIRFLTRPGGIVTAGQPIAKTYNAFGKIQETLTALNDGVVLGHTDSSVVFPGMPVMAFGILRGNQTAPLQNTTKD